MPSARQFTAEQAREVGEAIGIDWGTARFGLEEFRAGMEVELEHGNREAATDVTASDPVLTGKIALTHRVWSSVRDLRSRVWSRRYWMSCGGAHASGSTSRASSITSHRASRRSVLGRLRLPLKRTGLTGIGEPDIDAPRL